MRKKKFLAAMLALTMTFTSIQLPPMQVNAEETIDVQKITGFKNYWSFDTYDGVNVTSDAGAEEATGVLNGNNISIADSGSPVFGNVLRFGSGTDNFMKLTSYLNTGGQNTSFSMWYRYDTTITGDKNTSAVLLQHEGDGRIILDLNFDGRYHTYLNATNCYSNGSVTKGGWQHITVTFDQTAKKVCYYINGELDREQALGDSVVDQVLHLRLGAHKNDGADDPHPMRGDIDEFYVFEKALTAGEAEAVYNEKISEYKALLNEKITEATNLYKVVADKTEADVYEIDADHTEAFDAVNTAKENGTTVYTDADATMGEIDDEINAIDTAITNLRNIYLNNVKLQGSSLTLNGTIDVNFYMVLEDAEALKTAGAYMNFTLDGEDYSKVYVKDVETKVQDEITCHVFKCGIPVKDMGGEIKAQMVVPDSEGNVVQKGLVYTQSVKGYIEYILNDSQTYENEIELVSAMSDFGDFATVYFNGGSVSEDVLAKIKSADITGLSEYAPGDGEIPEKNIYVGSSLLLKSDTLFRHYFTQFVDVDGEYTCTQKDETGYYYIEHTGIAAHELGNKINITVTIGVEDQTITYSPLTYAYVALTNSDDENLKNLMRAMYLYYQAACDYDPN